jgi:hypothetical protein
MEGDADEAYPYLLRQQIKLCVSFIDPFPGKLKLDDYVLKHSSRKLKACFWPKNAVGVCTRVGSGSVDIYFGVDAKNPNFGGSGLQNEIVATDFHVLDLSSETNLFKDDIVRLESYNLYAWMLDRAYVASSTTTSTSASRYKSFEDLVVAASPILTKFVELSEDRAYTHAYENGPYDDIECEALKDVMYKSLKRGRRIFTPSMNWLMRPRFRDKEDGSALAHMVELDGNITIGEGIDVVMGEGLELETETYDIDVPPAIDSGIFPYSSSYKLSSTAISYKNTIDEPTTSRITRSKNRDLDLQYATFASNELSDWGDKGSCIAVLDRWQPLPPGRDYLTRFISQEGASMRTGLWSYCGTRAHRKCYARTLLGQLNADNDGIDYDQTQFQSANLNTDSPPHKMGDFVLAENGYMNLEESLSQKQLKWFAMNEGVTTNTMLSSSYKARDATDTASIEHFTQNLRRMNRAVCKADSQSSVEVAAEFSVYWPFGMHSRKSNEVGRVYETRADLITWGQSLKDDKGGARLVEYKTRMEISANVKDIYVFKKSKSDSLQLRLNTWMIYLDTGVFVPYAYVVQASRRTEDDEAPRLAVGLPRKPIPHGVVVRLSRHSEKEWASPGMVRLITTFAIHPYGPNSIARYIDDVFFVPDLTALMLGLGLQVGKALVFEEDTGRHAVFSQVLMSCGFSRAVDTAIGKSACKDTSLGLPDSCFAPGRTVGAGAKVHESLQDSVTNPIGLKSLLARFEAEWNTLECDKVPSASPTSACAVMRKAGFMPVLFNRDGNCLLYCRGNTRMTVHRTQFANRLSPLASRSAFVALSALPVFRESASGVKFDKRLRFGNDTIGNPMAMICERLRNKLARTVTLAATWIESKLSSEIGELQLERVEGSAFWEMTLNSIFRRHILDSSDVRIPHHPRVREFHEYETEPYASEPKQITELAALLSTHSYNLRRPSQRYRETLRKLRVSALCRCVHRLVNTRLLRGSLALVGVSHTIYDKVDNQHELSAEELNTWQILEEGALDDALAVSYNSASNPESREWWEDGRESSTGRNDNFSRYQVFSHMSQRAMWSRAALEAATGMMLEGHDSKEANVVHLARDHICEDLVYACKQHLSELENP